MPAEADQPIESSHVEAGAAGALPRGDLVADSRSDTETAGDTELAQLDTEVLPPRHAGEYPNAFRIDSYEIQGVIGKGGMGIVYKAKVVESCSIPIGKIVALKMLTTSRLDGQDRRRFDREAAYLQALRHPGIVRVLDIGEFDERPYLVMQLVEGQTLDQILRKRRRNGEAAHLSLSQAADILTQALEALHVAHIAGIVHRDLKPGNIMLTPQGAVKILDFGMAHKLDVDSHLTATGSVLGTPAYMSPEQASGRRNLIDARSDIYATGAVCYELVTGQQPFQAENSMAVLRLIIEGDLTPPSTLMPTTDRAFETIILKAMAHDPRDRYHTAEAMAEDLRRWSAGDRIRARRINPMLPLLRRAYHYRRTLSMVSLAVFVMAVLGILSIRYLIQVQATQREQDSRLQREAEELAAKTEIAIEEVLVRPEFDWSSTPFLVIRNTLLPDSYVTFQLGEVTTHPTLQLQVDALAQDTSLELMICGRIVGHGYSLQIQRDHEAGDQLVLLRRDINDEERLLVTRQRVDLARPFHLTFRRRFETGYIEALIDREVVIRFWDPTPIEGPSNAKVFLAGEPRKSTIRNLTLTRVVLPDLTSKLDLADRARHLGDYGTAITEYQDLLRKTDPSSKEERDIRYRLGLCYLAEDRRESTMEALAQFNKVAEISREDADKAYHLAAVVQAWVCTIRLGDFAAAERYFTDVRQHDLNQVLVSVPRATLDKVPEVYLRRARQALLGDEEDYLDRADSLFDTAARLADYLDQQETLAQAIDGNVEVALARDAFTEAAQLYRRLLDREDLPPSIADHIQLRLAGVERLSGRTTTAIELYRDMIDRLPDDEELGQWARIWLGDLLWYEGYPDDARQIWTESPESKTLPGMLMKNLSGRARQQSYKKKYSDWVIEFEYFNAVAWLMNESDSEAIEKYYDQLSRIRDRWSAGVWPTPLARQILANATSKTMD